MEGPLGCLWVSQPEDLSGFMQFSWLSSADEEFQAEMDGEQGENAAGGKYLGEICVRKMKRKTCG